MKELKLTNLEIILIKDLIYLKRYDLERSIETRRKVIEGCNSSEYIIKSLLEQDISSAERELEELKMLLDKLLR